MLKSIKQNSELKSKKVLANNMQLVKFSTTHKVPLDIKVSLTQTKLEICYFLCYIHTFIHIYTSFFILIFPHFI